MSAEANKIEQHAANTILDRGVRFALGEESITLRPLRFGTVLTICEEVCNAGLTSKKIEEGEDDLMQFFAAYAELMLRCVAIAELNDKKAINDKNILQKVSYYKDTLNAFQIYELFVHVLQLSGIQAFMNTIRLLLTMKTSHLSPKVKGS